MTGLIAATAFFVGIHLFVSGTTLRDKLVGAIGEGAYMGLFSLASLGGLFWMAQAYRTLETDTILWTAPLWFSHLGPIVVCLAFVLALAGLTTPNPTVVKGDSLLEKEGIVKGILTVTRHPFQWGVTLWALFHLLANGQLATTIFFGGLGALSFFGTYSIDKKRARKDGEAWEKFAAQTSNIPFAAIISGQAKLDIRGIGIARIVGGIVIYGAFVYFHMDLFGVSPVPGYAFE